MYVLFTLNYNQIFTLYTACYEVDGLFSRTEIPFGSSVEGH